MRNPNAPWEIRNERARLAWLARGRQRWAQMGHWRPAVVYAPLMMRHPARAARLVGIKPS